MWGLSLIIGWVGLAEAGPFTQKTSQGSAPTSQVARTLVMPKGWLEIGLRADTKRSTQHRNAQGVLTSHPGAWRTSRLWLDVRQGFSSRVTLYGSVPWVAAEFAPRVGTRTRTVAMGDAHVGIVTEPWTWKTTGLGMQLDMKAPSGVEWPGGVSAGPDQVESFLTGTGTTNVGGYLLGRAQFAERLRLQGTAGYVWKLPGVVGYVVQDDGFGNGWLDPGDEVVLDLQLTTQIVRPLAVSAGAHWSHRGRYRMGVSGPGTTTRNLEALPGGTGQFLDGQLEVSWTPTPHWEVHTHVARSLAGTDTRTFAHLGLEEFSPQPGNEFGLGLRARW